MNHIKLNFRLAVITFAGMTISSQCARTSPRMAEDILHIAMQPRQQHPTKVENELGFDYFEFNRPNLGSKVSLVYISQEDWWLTIFNVKFNYRNLGKVDRNGVFLDGPLKGNYQVSLDPDHHIHIMSPERAKRGFVPEEP